MKIEPLQTFELSGQSYKIEVMDGKELSFSKFQFLDFNDDWNPFHLNPLNDSLRAFSTKEVSSRLWTDLTPEPVSQGKREEVHPFQSREHEQGWNPFQFNALYESLQLIQLNKQIAACRLERDCEKARKVFEKISEEGLEPDTYSYTLLIQVYCRAGRRKEAENIFEQMKQMGIPPTEFTYSILMQSANEDKDYDSALAYYDRICNMKCRISDIPHQQALDTYIGQGRVGNAMQWGKRLDLIRKPFISEFKQRLSFDCHGISHGRALVSLLVFEQRNPGVDKLALITGQGNRTKNITMTDMRTYLKEHLHLFEKRWRFTICPRNPGIVFMEVIKNEEKACKE